MWQDYLLMAGGFMFSIGLLPSIFGKSKPSVYTSVITAITLTGFTVAYQTMGLTLASTSTGLTALLWCVLLIQKLRE